MPPVFMGSFPESDVIPLNFNDTELTLRLPGSSSCVGPGQFKTVDLNHGSSSRPPRGKACAYSDESDSEGSTTGKTPAAARGQVVGWPPVRSFRKKNIGSCCRYVKVAVDGAPYLRKVDLEAYVSYQELLRALEEMFACFVNIGDGRKLMNLGKGIEYVPTYEDKDGDWMLVGDVPWKMFKKSCKRVRLMKSSESLEIGN